MTMAETNATSPARAVILYGRSSFDRQQNVAAIAARLQAATGGDILFVAAYEDITGPALPEVMSRLAAQGLCEVLVVPCAVPADPTHTNWLPGALAAWGLAYAEQHGGAGLDVRIAPAVEAYLDIDAAVRAALAAPAEMLTDVAFVEPSLGKPGWTNIPQHRRQIFFCLGARCAQRGAISLYQHLRAVMKTHRALGSGPQRAMCVRTGCMFPCNQGPLMIVHPEGTWYGGLDRDRLARIVDEHLLNDRVVGEAVVHRQPVARTVDDGGT